MHGGDVVIAGIWRIRRLPRRIRREVRIGRAGIEVVIAHELAELEGPGPSPKDLLGPKDVLSPDTTQKRDLAFVPVLVVRQGRIDVDTAWRHDVVAEDTGPGLGWWPEVVQFRVAGCRDECAGPTENETCEVRVRRIKHFETGSEYFAWAPSVIAIKTDVVGAYMRGMTAGYAGDAVQTQYRVELSAWRWRMGVE